MLKEIRLQLKRDEYLADKLRIQQAMHHAGYQCSITEAGDLWQAYSDGMAAGWMCLPDADENIVGNLRPYFDTEWEL